MALASKMDSKIVIIDYNSGNVKSLGNMLEFLGHKYILSNKKEDILSADKLLFPGQGHFKQAIDNLKKSDLIDTIKTAIDNKIDFLGICLGLQILFEKSEEAPNVEGLGILEGECKKFNPNTNVKIPQVGWNKVIPTGIDKSFDADLEENHPKDKYFYFVNSYYVEPKDKNIISSYTNYGIKFCSSIKKDNLSAVQFHPEKSADYGIEFFKNWLK